MTAKTEPYICPICCAEPDNYYGRLVFPADLDLVELDGGFAGPICPNHRAEDGTPILVALIPVVR